MGHATDQPAPQHSPGVSAPHPTAPIPPAEAASRCQLAAAGRLDLIGAGA